MQTNIAYVLYNTYIYITYRLDLRTNKLSSLSHNCFQELSSLRYLLLADNHIAYIDKRAFRSLEKLMYLVGYSTVILTYHVFSRLLYSYINLSCIY